MKIALRVLGGLVAVIGAVLTLVPELAHGPTTDLPLFETIELRIAPGGALLGVGAFLLVRTRLRPWLGTLFCFAGVVVSGLLAARVLGCLLDGMSSGRQWMWVVVEAVVVGVAAALYAWAERRAAHAAEPAPEAG